MIIIGGINDYNWDKMIILNVSRVYMSHHCSICNINLSCKKSLKRHYLSSRHKSRVETKPDHTCDCGRSFTLLTNLSRHRKTCKGTKPEEPEKEVEEHKCANTIGHL